MNPVNSPQQSRVYPIRGASARSSTSGRAASVFLGVWLFFSAFLWPHDPAVRTSTWVTGLVIAAAATAAVFAPAARWVAMAASLWLLGSMLWLPHASTATVWNNGIVAVAVFIVSLVPVTGRPRSMV